MIPKKAFILAAGFGTRMRPLTNHLPKPLMAVNGQSLLTLTLNHLEEAGVQHVSINTHYLGDEIQSALEGREKPELNIIHEDPILDTGGGIKNALPALGNDAFYVLSGDGLWENVAHQNTLKTMADAWNPEIMDILILLQPTESMHLTTGVGDYDLDKSGKAVRSLNQTGAYMFTSMRINHPRAFDGTPDGAFSYLDLLDKAQRNGRLYGLIHAGEWHHISTPTDLDAVQSAYAENETHS